MDDHQESGECGGGMGTATISGTVTSGEAGANSFPVYLLNAGGTAVVANTTTAPDGTGSYSFTLVQPGMYLVCEADPFVAMYGFLAQTAPSSGALCPSGYGPRGYALTVAAGATAGGNDFVNSGIE